MKLKINYLVLSYTLSFLILIFCSAFPSKLVAQTTLLPLKSGYAVVTSYGDNVSSNVSDNRSVLGIINLNSWQSQRKNSNWNVNIYRGERNLAWTAGKLGPVFGLALDFNNNIYTTAFTYYYLNDFNSVRYKYGIGGAGAVYKIDGVTGAISVFAQLPNFTDVKAKREPALGNICFDKLNSQFFVTNFEDGKIYRLSLQGKVLSTFDPFTPDDNTKGFAPLKERVFGINSYSNKIYFSRYVEDEGRKSATENNQIYSVELVNGEFKTNSLKLEISMPPIASNYSNPVSDIAFSSDGKRMLVSERSILGDYGEFTAHKSRCLEYVQNPITNIWALENPTKYLIGSVVRGGAANGSNCAGGSSYGMRFDYMNKPECDSVVWSMGDALSLGNVNIYGLQGLQHSGGNINNSVLVDIDNDLGQQDKTQLGDVEIFRECCSDDNLKVKTDTVTFNYLDTIKVPIVFQQRLTKPATNDVLSFSYPTYSLNFLYLLGKNSDKINSFSINGTSSKDAVISISLLNKNYNLGDTIAFAYFVTSLTDTNSVSLNFNPVGCSNSYSTIIKFTGCGYGPNRAIELIEPTLINKVYQSNNNLIINFSCPTNINTDLNFYDLSGNLAFAFLKKESFVLINNTAEVPLSKLPSGFYVVELINPYGASRKKILIEK